jgi:hypothetical protein
MDMLCNFTGRGTGFIVHMLLPAAEGLTGHADTRQLQAPEYRQDHHKGKDEYDLPQMMPVRAVFI